MTTTASPENDVPTPEQVAAIKAAIVALLERRSMVSFLDLEQIDGFQGHYAVGRVSEKVYYWFGVSRAAAKALRELYWDGDILLAGAAPEFYLEQGVALPAPVTTLPFKACEVASWYPVVLVRYKLASRLPQSPFSGQDETGGDEPARSSANAVESEESIHDT